MANSLYDPAREKYLTGEFNWSADDIRVALVSTSAGDNPYTFNASHEFLDSIHPNAIRSQSGALENKAVGDGKAQADNITFTAVEGAEAGALVIYVHNADPAAAALIAYLDTGVGLPVLPNGGDIYITWGDYIFQI